MFKIDGHIKLDAEAIKSPNLCSRFSKADLQKIGNQVHEGYTRDKQSRYKWEKRTQAAMDLAMQIQKEKNFPWPGAANIAFPLVTIAALQFHSRAYPAIISGLEVVKCRVIGEDNDGKKTLRADRISTHMSWQVLEEDQSWEEQQDRLLITLPIIGTAFKKSYYEASKGHKVAELVMANDLVLDYYAKSVESCPRKTHLIPLFRNQVYEGIQRKIFRDVREESWYNQPAAPQTGMIESRRDTRTGLNPPVSDETTPFMSFEQHVDLDLDGDGYAEPYIITIEQVSKAVLRIVTGFDREEDIERNRKGEIISVRRMEYFTCYTFLPSPDGGILGVGFGVLLGPLNESTNSLINQLMDAGTWSVTAGGFLGRGAKIRGGVYTFSPLEWKRVDSTGDDLRKNIVPHQPREPSTVLFQLLSLLINYVQRISGTTDPMVGESTGQNTPAETTRSMVQEGSRIYSAVFKRVWRSMKEEFKKGYILNGIYMPFKKSFGSGQFALREDYLGNPDEVAPAADPNVSSEQMLFAQAQAMKASASTTPGYDVEAVERRYLKALKIPDIAQIYPGIEKTGQHEDVKLTIAKLKKEGEDARLQSEQQRFIMTLMEEQKMNNAEIIKMSAEVQQMQIDSEGDVEDRQISRMNAMLGMMKLRNEQITQRMDRMIKAMELKNDEGAADAGDVSRLAAASGDGAVAAGAGAEAAIA